MGIVTLTAFGQPDAAGGFLVSITRGTVTVRPPYSDNARTARGGDWHATTVRNLLGREAG